MTRAVIADTGPLYAAVDPDDAHHKRAGKELDRLSREKREVVVPYPTLLEAYTLVLFRLGKSVASRWLGDMAEATLVNPSAEDYRQAAIKIRALADHPITDPHFDLLRVKVWR